MTQVETIWGFINHSNCEVTWNRTCQSGPFWTEDISVWLFQSGDILVTISIHKQLYIPLIK